MTEGFWAYVTLSLTGFIGSELVPLLSGIAVEEGQLLFTPAAVSIVAGVWTVMSLLYFVGRTNAAWVRLKLRDAPRVVQRSLEVVRYNPWRATILARFLFGGRMLLPLACGAARVPLWKFMSGALISTVLWVFVYMTVGWAVGPGAAVVAAKVRSLGRVVSVLLVAGCVGIFLWWRRRRRARRAQG